MTGQIYFFFCTHKTKKAALGTRSQHSFTNFTLNTVWQNKINEKLWHAHSFSLHSTPRKYFQLFAIIISGEKKSVLMLLLTASSKKQRIKQCCAPKPSGESHVLTRENAWKWLCCTTNSASEGQAQTLAWMFGSEGCNYLGTMWKCCNYKANVWSAFIARRSADLNETHSLRGTSIKLAWNVNGVDFEKSLSAKTAWTLMLSVCASTLNIRKGKETKHSDSFWLHWICLYFRCERRDRIKSVLYKVKQSMPTASLCA